MGINFFRLTQSVYAAFFVAVPTLGGKQRGMGKEEMWLGFTMYDLRAAEILFGIL
jgi:hypothetical protein